MIRVHSLEFFYSLDQFHLNVPDHGDFLMAISQEVDNLKPAFR